MAPQRGPANRSRADNVTENRLRMQCEFMELGCAFRQLDSRRDGGGSSGLFTGPQVLLIKRGLARSAWGLEVPVGVTGIVIRVSESLAVVQEEFDRFNWYCQPQAFPKRYFHVGDAYHLAAHIKERSATVARIDLSRRLQEEFPRHLPRFCA